MDTEREREQYELAERAFLEAIRERDDWSSLGSKAADLAARAASWNAAEHAAWRDATDEISRNALSVSTDSTELISALWRDVALAFEGKPATPY